MQGNKIVSNFSIQMEGNACTFQGVSLYLPGHLTAVSE